MTQQERFIQGISDFGVYLGHVHEGLKENSASNELDHEVLNRWNQLLLQVYSQNAWYTREDVLFALEAWKNLLNLDDVSTWIKGYSALKETSAKTVALILAGNIPLVGFHDLLSVLITGHRALVKQASNDTLLLPFLISEMEQFIPGISAFVTFTDKKLEDFDAVIATGSNNTGRYFEYYFASTPHIIRKNRNSVAVLTGSETPLELDGLAEDVFRYFGMGCRSVSKIFVPEGYNFDPLFQSFYKTRDLIHHQKYANNYDYNKAVFLMSGAAMLDNGFLLLKEDQGLGSPIGTLFYESYKDISHLSQRLILDAEALQCVVGPTNISGAIPFGTSQLPGLSTYADGVDTIKFLTELS